jgi:D-alanine-D-alanine ligase
MHGRDNPEPQAMPKPPILVLYNKPVLPPNHPEAGSEYDILETVSDTAKILDAGGFGVRQLGIDRDPRPLLDELRDYPPLAVFNLFEGLATQPGTEVSVAALLEWLGVSFTGCPSPALVWGRDKIRTKHLLAAAGLPTAPYLVVEDEPVPEWTGGWPAIIKPALQDASVGIDQGSVVASRGELVARARFLLDRFGPPVLVEQFLTGRELLVHVIETGPGAAPRALPASEIAYQEDRSDRWPVYTFTAKWDEGSDEFKTAKVVAPVTLPPDEFTRAAALATRAFRLLQCRDYARLDLRTDAGGAFHVLEVNPNPYLNSLALVKGLEAVGRTHEWFVVNIMLDAIARGGGHLAPGAITVPVGVVTPA